MRPDNVKSNPALVDISGFNNAEISALAIAVQICSKIPH
jgi:hypothetical protein